MPNPMIRIHDLATDEIVDREMTKQEFDAYKAQKIVDEAAIAEREAKQASKAAILERLGLTAEEAVLLLS